MSTEKKVLIVTYLPWATPRIPALARYLPEFGWEPVILTPPLSRKPEAWLRVVETPCRDSLRLVKRLLGISPAADDTRPEIKRKLGIKAARPLLDFLLTRGGEIVNYPDSKKGWKPFGIETGSRLIREEKVNAILSSSSPVTGAVIARELKARHDIPWVADFRDLWSQNHNYSYSPLRRFFDRRLERRTLSEADGLVTVSQPWADKLSRLHGGKLTYTITNGFDPAETDSTLEELTTKFTITYTGMIYHRKQHPWKLFTALKELRAKGMIAPQDIEVRFYGPYERWLEEEINKYGVSDLVKQCGILPQKEALARQRQSQLLLLFDWDDPQEKGVYPGKVFEYLAAGRPILAVGGAAGNVIARLLDSTRTGEHAPTVADIEKAIAKFYQEYKLHGKTFYQGDESEISKYSYREMARKFAEILDSLTS